MNNAALAETAKAFLFGLKPAGGWRVRLQDAVGVVVYAEFIPHRILSAGEQCDDGRSIP
jgi:hypothetical protein